LGQGLGNVTDELVLVQVVGRGVVEHQLRGAALQLQRRIRQVVVPGGSFLSNITFSSRRTPWAR